jgi:DNA polymerase III epsilon subunit-like protein
MQGNANAKCISREVKALNKTLAQRGVTQRVTVAIAQQEFHVLISEEKMIRGLESGSRMDQGEIEALARQRLPQRLEEIMDEIVEKDLWEKRVENQKLNEILARQMLGRNNAALTEMRANTPSFDESQRLDIINEAYKGEIDILTGQGISPLSSVSQHTWDEWNRKEAGRSGENFGVNSRESQHYENQIGVAPPNVLDFAVMQRIPLAGELAVVSLDRETRYVAGINDIAPADAKAAYLQAREEHLNNPDNASMIAPEWFTSAIRQGAYDTGVAKWKRPPLDPSTAWALHAVTSDLTRTKQYTRMNNGYIVFDTETTGLNHDSEIIQITAIQYDGNGHQVDRVSTHINPGADQNGIIFTGPKDAIAVHGITGESLANAPAFKNVAPKLYAMMEGRTLVAQNIMFDYPKVQRALNLAGHSTLTPGPMVDTLRLARYVDHVPKGETFDTYKHKLRTSCERAGLPFDENLAHDAEYDVNRTNALFQFLKTKKL